MGGNERPVRVPVRAIDLVPDARRPWVETDSVIRQLFRLLEAGPRTPPSLARVARGDAVGVRTIERRFQEVTDRTYRKFLKEWRLQWAWKALCGGTHSPREAMLAVGRTGLSAFSRDFKIRFSSTPKEVYDSARAWKKGTRGSQNNPSARKRAERHPRNIISGKRLGEN